MSQTVWGTIVASSTSGNQLASYLNDFKNAVMSGMSGTTRPSQTTAGGSWIDTTGNPSYWDYKVWTGAQDITVFRLNLLTGTTSVTGSDSSFEIAKVSADSVGPMLKLLKERIASNGQTLTGDYLGEIQFIGAADDLSNPIVCRIRAISSDDATATASGGYLVFETTVDATAAIAEHMRLIDGKLGIGITAPEASLHTKGLTGVKFERKADDATASKVIVKKHRVLTNGQVLANDAISEFQSISVDELGAEFISSKILVEAIENHTSTAHGTRMTFQVQKVGEVALSSFLTVTDVATFGFNVVVPTLTATTLNVTTLNATNYYSGTIVEYADAQITVNKGGNATSAQSAKAGVRVEIGGGTDHILVGYDNTTASGVVSGPSGAEKELVNVDASQNLSNKKLVTLSLDSQDVATAASITALSTAKAIVNLTGATETQIAGVDATGVTKAMLIHNGSTAKVTILNESLGATATNRMKLPSNRDISIQANESIELFYSTTESRWKLKSGSGSGGGQLIDKGAQSIAANGTITVTTTDIRQIIKVASTGGVVDLNVLPFGATYSPDGPIEFVIVGDGESDIVRLPYNDVDYGCVGNFDFIEITKLLPVKVVYYPLTKRFYVARGV